MPSLTVVLALSEKPFNEKQSNAVIRDSKGTAIYAPVVTVDGENTTDLKEKIDNLINAVFDNYIGRNKRSDFILTLQAPLTKSSEEPLEGPKEE